MNYKIILTILLFTGFLKTYGQDTLQNKKVYKLPKTETTIYASLRFPIGSFGSTFKPNENSNSGGLVESMEGTNGGMGANMGYEMGIATNYFFDKKPSNWNTGLRVTYVSFSTIPFTWKATEKSLLDDAEYKNLDFLSVKAGVVLRKALAEKKSFEFYDQLIFAYSWNGAINYDDTYSINSYTTVSDQLSVEINSGTGLRNETGISYRSGGFVVNLGISFGKINYNDISYIRNLSSSGYTPLNDDETYKSSMSLSSVDLSIGVGF